MDGPSSETITDLALKECSLRLNQPGDVLIAMYGATIGKLAILQVPATTNQAVCACTCFSSVYNRYLFTFLLAWRKNFAVMGAGAAQPNISRIKIIQTPFPLPPLAEQKRIVAKVDELMALCAALEAAQQTRNTLRQNLRASALDALMNASSNSELETAWAFVRDNWGLMCDQAEDVEEFRQVIFQQAVEGQLSDRQANDEDANLIVNRALKKKHDLEKLKKITKRQEQALVEDDEISFDLPEKWACVRFGDVADVVSGVTKGRKLAGRETAHYPYLRVANVQRWKLDLKVMKEIGIPIEELDKYRLQIGDVLLTEGGDWDKLGRSAIWCGEIQDCIHQNHVFRARFLDEGILPEWIVLFTNSYVGRRYFERAAKRTTNLASINMTQLRFCPLPIPPLAEQNRIVAKVDELMKLCDQLEESLRQQHQKAEALVASAINLLAA
ncbi:restriction endonuclease subunit S [filamentous cyanobacterium CCT1]|nr:restriction endonuclease subunit S [filamentous cyanobacterium CCT1]PSN78706.1 restriction endonuclease subunit S [filamentous cyanobacterium CCP4]